MIVHDPNKPIHHGWHLDKRISLAHIMTTVSLLFGLGSVIYAIETRVTLVEQRVITHEAVTDVELAAIKDNDRNIAVEMTRHYMEIRKSLIRIEDQLDRHSENSATHGSKSGS